MRRSRLERQRNGNTAFHTFPLRIRKPKNRLNSGVGMPNENSVFVSSRVHAYSQYRVCIMNSFFFFFLRFLRYNLRFG